MCGEAILERVHLLLIYLLIILRREIIPSAKFYFDGMKKIDTNKFWILDNFNAEINIISIIFMLFNFFLQLQMRGHPVGKHTLLCVFNKIRQDVFFIFRSKIIAKIFRHTVGERTI